MVEREKNEQVGWPWRDRKMNKLILKRENKVLRMWDKRHTENKFTPEKWP